MILLQVDVFSLVFVPELTGHHAVTLPNVFRRLHIEYGGRTHEYGALMLCLLPQHYQRSDYESMLLMMTIDALNVPIGDDFCDVEFYEDTFFCSAYICDPDAEYPYEPI